MNKIYLVSLLLLASVSFLSGCSKDFLKRYENRIEGGTWELYKTKSHGWGRSFNVAFNSGYFTFLPNGRLEYEDLSGNLYDGSWDMRVDYIQDDRRVRTLLITAVDFVTQDVFSEYFDEIRFTATNRFCAYIYGVNKTYIFYFKR